MFNILVQPDYVAINHCSFLQNGLQSLYASSKHIRQRFVRIIIFSTAAHLHMRGISCPYQEKKQGNIITKQEGDVGEGRKDLTPHPSFSTPSHAPAKVICLLLHLSSLTENLMQANCTKTTELRFVEIVFQWKVLRKKEFVELM